ncbi:hypothetical protein SAMN05518672_104304 [Chitinophaga sp. CF118]|uniref:hypothetical protein n=1 Tax=Chitinophaga sp. CF118 TaxID=1884367 RepID=UPI0008EB0163|nr:hypothetical protein [Chitinophaga sp. CF118]SFE05679.1 hypothetical protein SAMN05518672_104304 [Chitinophaga sp. CF118]
MKRVLYLLPVALMLLFACTKNKNKGQDPNITICPCPVNPLSLEGPWQLSASWNSPGAGPVIWRPATENETISFTTSGLFSSNKKDYDHFTIIPSNNFEYPDTILKLYKQGGKDTSSFIVKVNTDTLYLYYIGCIEGCASKYARPKLGTF